MCLPLHPRVRATGSQVTLPALASGSPIHMPSNRVATPDSGPQAPRPKPVHGCFSKARTPRHRRRASAAAWAERPARRRDSARFRIQCGSAAARLAISSDLCYAGVSCHRDCRRALRAVTGPERRRGHDKHRAAVPRPRQRASRSETMLFLDRLRAGAFGFDHGRCSV